MKRIPGYVIVALCGLIFVSAGLLGMFADNTDTTAPPESGDAPVVEQVLPTPTMTLEVVQEVVAAPPVVSAPVDTAPVQSPADNPPPVAAQPVVVEPPVVAPIETAPPVVVPPPADAQPIPTAITDVQPTPTDVVAAQVVPTVEVPVQPAPTEVLPTQQLTPETSSQDSRDVPAAPPDSGAPTLSAPVKPVATATTGIAPTSVVVEQQPLPTDAAPLLPALVPTVEVVVPAVIPTDAGAVVAPGVTVGQLSGVVSFPDAQDFTGITVLLTLPDGTQLQNVTSAQGTFEFLNLAPGSYRVVASAQGYLSRQLDFTLTDGQAMQLPSTFLVAGDTNFDNVIDLNDAALVASNFDGPATVQTADPNRDGWVDVRDLALIGADFGLTGPIPWQ